MTNQKLPKICLEVKHLKDSLSFITFTNLLHLEFEHVQSRQHFKVIFGFKNFTAPLTVLHLLLPLKIPHFFEFAILAPFFVNFAGHNLGSFSSVGRVFTKCLRITKLFWTNHRWVVEQNLLWNFRVKITCFLHVSLDCLTESLILVWFENLLLLDKLAVKAVLDH